MDLGAFQQGTTEVSRLVSVYKGKQHSWTFSTVMCVSPFVFFPEDMWLTAGLWLNTAH